MIDTDKYEGHTEGPWEPYEIKTTRRKSRMWTIGNLSVEWKEADKNLVADAPLLLEAYKRLQKENKILAKYREIVQRYDDALLADGDTDPRWSELYD
jgi:hypothetical protein